MSNYFSTSSDSYYTQRWYIARKEEGSEAVYDYYPPSDDESIRSGDEWVRYTTSNALFTPSDTQQEQILSNSESYAGWSRAEVERLNAQSTGFTYAFYSSLCGHIITKNGEQKQKAYADEIHVTKSWSNTEVVYEDVFDSYSMDFDTFMAQFQVRLTAYNANEDGYVYYAASDSKNYYQATNAEKLAGCECVTFSVTCSDGVSLGEGSTLNDHTKTCAMLTSVTDNDLDLSGLQQQLSDAESEMSSIQARINVLEETNAGLLNKIADADVDDAATYRSNTIRTRAR